MEQILVHQRTIVAVDEVESVIVNGELLIRLFIRIINLHLSLLEHYLRGNVEILIIYFSEFYVVHLKTELLGNSRV
jgi:hypothetical protein